MKHLVSYIKESLFDKDLVQQDPIDLSWAKRMNKSELFYCIEAYLNCADIDMLPQDVAEIYHKHEDGFNFIQHYLYEAFTKQNYSSWIVVNEDDFEDVGDGMTDEEIDQANKELADFFKNAKYTERNSHFLACKDKIPNFILNILKSSDHWKPQMANIKNWAVEYYSDYTQVLSFYGCPKNLNPIIKKLLYE